MAVFQCDLVTKCKNTTFCLNLFRISPQYIIHSPRLISINQYNITLW